VLCLWNVRKLRSRWLKRMTQRIPGCIAREKKKRKWSSNTKLNPQTDNWMQDFFWDSWADEVFMSQSISTSGGRETIKINRLGQEDASGIRPYISSMTITEAGHGDVISIHRITNKLWIWVNWTHYDTDGARHRDLVRFPWKSGTYTWNSKNAEHPDHAELPS
jgi:hypothetical protein